MASRGEVPGGPSPLPLAPEGWYAAQAIWVLPVVLGQWFLLSAIAWRVGRRAGGRGRFARTADLVGVGWPLPLAAWVIVSIALPRSRRSR